MYRVDLKTDSRYPVNRQRVRRVLERILTEHGLGEDTRVSLAVVGSRKMKQLNRDFHDEDYATDVLSFPYQDPLSNQDVEGFVIPDEEGMVLGDIVICYPIARAQAAAEHTLVDEKVDFLVEHGMLHLLGIHHD